MKYIIKILAVVTCCILVQTSFAQEKFKDLRVIIKNETGVNSPSLEYSPAFYNGGLIFISNQNPGLKYVRKDGSNLYSADQKFTNSIYESKRAENGVLGDPFLFAEDITTTFHEGPVSFSKDEKVIYFTRNNFIKTKRGKASNGTTKLKIYTAERIGNYWAKQKEVAGLNSDEFNTCHPSISSDGKKLYFASDRSGGKGGLDIYVSNLKSDGTWGKPEALTDINTAKSDGFPFVHNNGTLFFASNGYDDGKDYDIFYTDKKDETWRNPVNLVPFNTNYDDFGLILNPEKQHGFFTSNRPDGMGQDDIYSFTIDGYLSINDDLDGLPITLGNGEKEDKKCDVKLIVTDKLTGEKISGAKVDYTTLSNLSLIKSLVDDGNGNLVDIVPLNADKNEYLLRLRFDESEDAKSATTNTQGEFGNELKCEEHVFRVFKEGYSPRQVVYSPNGENEINVVLTKLINSMNVDGSVVNSTTNKGIPSASVTITDDMTQEIQTIPTDRNGNFVFEGKCNHTYTVKAVKSGISSTTESYKISPDCVEGKDLLLKINEPLADIGLRDGDIIYLPNIYYDFNKATIRLDATDDLDALAVILLELPNIDIELSSHTDSRGNNDYNRRLSQRRASAAKTYLVSKGIAAGRIKEIGYGEDQLKNQCADGVECSEEEHQYNRRTEVKVTNTNSSLQFRSKNNPPKTIDTRN